MNRIDVVAIDGSVDGAYHFCLEPGELIQNFLLLDSARGISDVGAQQHIRNWLTEMHKNYNA
jgi:hypothetical protein